MQLKRSHTMNNKQKAVAAQQMNPPFLKLIFLAFVCGIVPFLIYMNSIHSPFILDDRIRIVENPEIREITFKNLFYPHQRMFKEDYSHSDPSRPVVFFIYSLIYRGFQLNPVGYHLTNILFHSLNTIILFFIFQKIFSPHVNHSLGMALLGAVLFSCHPINSHTLNYVYCLNDTMMMFFFIVSILFFIMGIEKSGTYHLGTTLFYIAALFSKQSAVVLPATAFILDYLLISGGDLKHVLSRKKVYISFIAVSLLYIGYRYFLFGSIGDIEAASTWGRMEYFLTEPRVILNYLSFLVYPFGFSLEHFVRLVNGFSSPAFFVPFAVLISSGGFLFYYFLKKRNFISRLLVFCYSWYLIVLSPTSSFFPTTRVMMENRIYLAAAPIFFLFSYGLMVYFSFPLRLLLMVSAIGFLSFLTVKRNNLFKDPLLLWQQTVRNYPDFGFGYYNIAEILHFREKNFPEAESFYQKAVYFDQTIDKAFINLGIGYLQQKKYDNAVAVYENALQSIHDHPLIFYNLGLAYYGKGDFLKANKNFKMAILIQPAFQKAKDFMNYSYERMKK